MRKLGERRSSIRRQCEIDLQVVITRVSGRFHATIPSLNAFDTGDSLSEALEGAVDGAIGKLELAYDRGQFDAYLERSGFTKKGTHFCCSVETADEQRSEHLNSITWDADDPDKGQIAVLGLKLIRLETQVQFSAEEHLPLWERRYDREAEGFAQATC